MRYLDEEVDAEERVRIEQALRESTELRREIAVYRAMKEELQSLHLGPGGRDFTIWDRVNRRIARPMGWAFLVAGVLVWLAYGTYTYLTSSIDLWEKLATGAIVIGVLMLLASVIWEQYRAWLSEPYRDVER